jgi:hypothetical protein
VSTHRSAQRVLLAKIIRILEPAKIRLPVQRSEIKPLNIAEEDELALSALVESLVYAFELFGQPTGRTDRGLV